MTRNVTVPTQLDMLKRTGRYKAFDLEWQDYYSSAMTVWPVPQHLFWESDIAKFVEGGCYFLQMQDDSKLREVVDHLVNMIEKAQQPDGYLNIHFVVCEPSKRWSNLRDLHELYNAGHLIEAAVAHFNLTGSRQFVNVMLRFVKYASSVFGREPGKKRGYPGHPEIELALIRLHHLTDDAECLDLAEYFLTERGAQGGKYFTDEQLLRGEHPQLAPEMMPKKQSYWYMQAHKPIAEQQTIEGHSVRAMYLLTAVADLILASAGKGHHDLKDALYRLWKDMCNKKTYVTGGIGSIKQWEGFSPTAYFLPNGFDEGGCYNETCASIGQLMLADRMQALALDGPQVTDIAERALYNSSVTTGMSIDGRAFTYDNQLASSPGNPCQRHTWFECACCPPNVLRTLAVIGGYFWAPLQEGGLAIHHPFDGTIKHDGVEIVLKTEYPWDGHIQITVKGAQSERDRVRLRVPAWSKDWTASWSEKGHSNGSAIAADGYATLPAGNGVHEVDLKLKPRLIFSHPHTTQDMVTVAYGPLIYCVEDVDNPFEGNHFKDMTISADAQLVTERRPDLGGIVVIHAPKAGRQRQVPGEGAVRLPEMDHPPVMASEAHDLTFVPYYFRANRGGQGQMRVSLQRRL